MMEPQQLVDESRAPAYRDADDHHSKRWALWHHQFDLVRASDGVRYLRRWWIVKTPIGGIMLHRMDAPDARETIHDHPFTFASLVLRGGYIERRLDPMTMAVDEHHMVRRVNVMRKHDGHSIRELLRVPTWTLVLVGRHRRTWGFWTPEVPDAEMWLGHPARDWRWTKHDAYDSGHYKPS